MAYEKELAFAKEMAREAGAIMRKYYRSGQRVEVKSDNSPVTIADKEINTVLIERIKSLFPDDGVLGEEESWQPDRDRVWVCDPIDGTSAYIIKIPLSMFSLALTIGGRPVVAVAHNPGIDDMYTAVEGEGAFRNDEPIHVSARKWSNSTHVTGTRGRIYRGVKAQLENVPDVHAYDILGGVFKGCLVAEGSVEAWVFEHQGAHDIAATQLIVQEAGGKVTDIDGNEQRYDKPINGALLTNGVVHQELLDIIQKVK